MPLTNDDLNFFVELAQQHVRLIQQAVETGDRDLAGRLRRRFVRLEDLPSDEAQQLRE